MKPAKANRAVREFSRSIQAGDLLRAKTLGRQLQTIYPHQSQLLNMLGSVHARLGEYMAAEQCFRELVSIQARDHIHYRNLGLALVMQERLSEAVPVFARMLELQPGFAEGHMQMGCLLRDLGQHDNAIGHFVRALQLSPDLVDAAVYSANLYVFRGDMEKALQFYDRALSRYPDHPDAIAGKSLALEHLGEKNEAWSLLQPLLKRGSLTPAVVISYALLAPGFDATQHARRLLEDVLSRADLAPSQRQELYFSLGRICDKAGDYDAAFENYRAGNQLARHVPELEKFREKSRRIKEVFSRLNMVNVSANSMGGPIPIFIVGMPRSGSTLVEQVLASHPDVAPGGELEYLPEIEVMLHEAYDRGFPECLLDAGDNELASFAEHYRSRIAQIGSGAKFITDKLPSNYERLGLIRLLFPDALIIHVVRDPRDTCLSCYFQNFGHTHSYSTNLQSLVEMYHAYDDLMKFWTRVHSIPVFEVSYESFVENLENGVRTLLQFCGLAWNNDCLTFYSNRRVVSTASYDQVRRPLYVSSIGRWRNYSQYIGEAFGAL